MTGVEVHVHDTYFIITNGQSLTRWTVRIALLLYFAALIGPRSTARTLYTLGLLFYLTHVAAAFHFFHHWSHTNAYIETARQTNALFHLNWGGGLYFNYAFSLLWLIDAIWWWTAPEARPERVQRVEWAYNHRPAWLAATIHGFIAFMAFNATVIFAHGPVRWIAAAAFAILLAKLLANQKGKVRA